MHHRSAHPLTTDHWLLTPSALVAVILRHYQPVKPSVHDADADASEVGTEYVRVMSGRVHQPFVRELQRGRHRQILTRGAESVSCISDAIEGRFPLGSLMGEV